MLNSSSFRFRTTILSPPPPPHHHHDLPCASRNLSPFTLQSNPNSEYRCLLFLKPPPLETRPALTLFVLQAKSPAAGEQKWLHEGLITESLPNGMFRIRLDNEDLILGYVSGKIRKNLVRILPGDRVKVEVSRYDTSKGRIIYRLRSSS